MENINTVEVTEMESVLDDAAPAPETEAAALSEAINDLAPDAGVANQASTEEALEEPTDKGLRGRMHQFEQRGYKKGARETEAKWADEKKELLERIARYETENLKREAKEFAQKHNMSEELAFKYLSLEKGSPVAEQPRDEGGRFASKSSETEPAGDADVRARAVTLMAQAEAFEKMSDGAVTREQILDTYQNDSDVQQKVASGEWDFTDVGKHLSGPQKRAPKVSRSTSNGQINTSYFSGMSDADFAKFDEKIRLGAVYDARR